jgi:2'-5' RNA ligase
VETPDAQRLFFALWPDDDVRAQIRSAARALIPHQAKAVSGDNLHITLAFLGRVAAPVRGCLERAAAAIRLPAFTLRLDRCGYWHRPRVLWLGADPAPEPLLALVRALAAGTVDCGLEPERRPYQVHLTVARKARRAVREGAIEPIEWGVERFCLVQSLTLPEGAVYRVLQSWPLTPGSAPADV